MNETKDTRQGSVITIEAVVFPVCECGYPYPKHEPDVVVAGLVMCSNYRPVRPVENRGVIARREG